MIKLSKEKLMAMGEEGEEIQSFIDRVDLKIYQREDFSIWAESKELVSFMKLLPEGKGHFFDGVPIHNKVILYHLFENASKGMNIKYVVVDDEKKSSDNWIFEDLGLWIMTTSYFVTLLYVNYEKKGWDTRDLIAYCRATGIVIEVM